MPPGIYPGNKGRKHSLETRIKMSESHKGEKAYQWKGNKVGYFALHSWLRKTFGKANKCESINCSKISVIFEWAKVKGKKYERKRDNFTQLCRSCHRKYDMTDLKKEKAIKNLTWYSISIKNG